MKKYFLFIAGFILLFNSIATSQIIADTVVIDEGPRTASIESSYDLIRKMQNDKDDSWLFSGGPLGGNSLDLEKNPKFDVWIKLKSNYKSGPVFHLGSNNGSSMYGMLYDAVEMELATTSITPENANNYQYNVRTVDGLDLVPWSKPTMFKSNKFTSYAYLGKFNCAHKAIILTILETVNKRRRASVYVYNNEYHNTASIKNIFVKYPTGLVAQDPSLWIKGFRIWPLKFPLSIQLEIDNGINIEQQYVYLKRRHKGKLDIIPVGNRWEKSSDDANPRLTINRSLFIKPGRYTIIIQPEMKVIDEVPPVNIGNDEWAHFDIRLNPTTIPVKTAGYILFILIIIAGSIFLIYRRRQNIKLAREEKDKTIATLQLQSVRAQLNPHFIFNALSGIQNLMNKNEVENANKYLARFARLTRHVLDEAQKELTPIADEVSLLTDYLEMEQMRFGFKFSINVDGNVDQQIEIPAMLLQPFVENAVKHGISALKNEGFIGVNISQTEKDIILKVNDNGGGFVSTQTPGMGIKLCEERVKLLNSIYKNSTILLHINSTPIGAIIGIELKNWL